VFQHLKNDRETRVVLRLFQRACMAEALSEHLFRDVKRVLVRRSAF